MREAFLHYPKGIVVYLLSHYENRWDIRVPSGGRPSEYSLESSREEDGGFRSG